MMLFRFVFAYMDLEKIFISFIGTDNLNKACDVIRKTTSLI